MLDRPAVYSLGASNIVAISLVRFNYERVVIGPFHLWTSCDWSSVESFDRNFLTFSENFVVVFFFRVSNSVVYFDREDGRRKWGSTGFHYKAGVKVDEIFLVPGCEGPVQLYAYWMAFLTIREQIELVLLNCTRCARAIRPNSFNLFPNCQKGHSIWCKYDIGSTPIAF